ncbi:hypothetical protein FOBRF1_007110 [Fusarium oxysporum]
MTDLREVAVAKGSLVLVTGVSGFIGSNVADQFLHYGYKVRGTVRDTEKGLWLKTLFDAKYGEGNFELVPVTDMAADGAFRDVIKGVCAVAHVASDMSFDPNPYNVIPSVVAGAVNVLNAALAEPSVKRFTYTSSSSAAVLSSQSRPGIVVTQDTWNEASVQEAWAEPPYGPQRSSAVYAASKTAAEKEIWKCYREFPFRRRDFVLNTVLPNVNFGSSLNTEVQGHPSSSIFPVLLWNGEVSSLKSIVPQYFIDVQDTARLHVAATVLPDVNEERIFGFAGRFNWDAILDILRKQNPGRRFIPNFSDGKDLNEIRPMVRAEEILRKLGRPGWTSLEDSIMANTADLRGLD